MLPPTTAEQRKIHYSDVEALLNPGFLSHAITVRGTRFCLRTLSPGDLFLLRNRANGLSDKEWQRWAIASCIWMVDGYNLLGEGNHVPRLYRMVRRLPSRAHRILYNTILGLFSRAEKAAEGVESYIYEDAARSKWRMMGRTEFPHHLGVPGAVGLGVNFIQQIWMAFNMVEDDKQTADQQWEGFKLVASTQAPKGIQKIDTKDKQRHREEQARRQSVMDRFYYYRVGKVDREGYLKDKNRDLIGAVIHQPKSPDQLSDEYRRWVDGDMDQHDMIVESYKNQIMARRAEEDRQREARRAALHREIERREAADMEPLSLVAYSPAQLQQILAERNVGQPRGRRIYDDQQAKNERYINNFLVKEQRRGAVQKTADGRYADADPHAVERHDQIQNSLENRKVQFGAPPQPQGVPVPPPQPELNHPNPQVRAYLQQQRRMAEEAGVENLVNPEIFGVQRGGSR